MPGDGIEIIVLFVRPVAIDDVCILSTSSLPKLARRVAEILFSTR